jgi:hypothetical protein
VWRVKTRVHPSPFTPRIKLNINFNLVEKKQIMATNTNNKNNTNNQKTESFVCIYINKLRKNPEGYSSFLKAVYRTLLPVDCARVYIAFPSGSEMEGRGGVPPEKFDELVDALAEQCKDSTDEDWGV